MKKLLLILFVLSALLSCGKVGPLQHEGKSKRPVFTGVFDE